MELLNARRASLWLKENEVLSPPTIRVFRTILTIDDKFLRVSLQVLSPQRVHGVRKAAFGHESVNVTQLVGAGLHHLLLRHRQRLHAQHVRADFKSNNSYKRSAIKLFN